MSKKNIVLTTIIVLALAAGAFWYYSWIAEVNYLIPGVPYNGVYNLFFQNADSTTVSSVMDILGYWGDDRFSVSDLKEKFIVTASSTKTEVSSSLGFQTTLTVKNFFEDNGYQVYRWASSDSGNALKEIKKFANPTQKIPVIVYQKRYYLDTAEPVTGFRVVIGIFDKDKKVIVHDHDFGNNYEISYENFEKMFTENSRAILAVWPSDNLKASLKGSNYNASYPPRLESMDKIGLLLVTKGAQAVSYFRSQNFEKSSAFFKEIVDSPDFQYFPPAFQVTELSSLAWLYSYLGEYDKAIKLMTERVLPLNQNLNKPFPDWVVLSVDRYVYPYQTLSQAYLKNGQHDLALATYKEMVKWRELVYKETGNKDILKMKIDELEKAISSKK